MTTKKQLTAAGFESTIFDGIYERGDFRIEIDGRNLELRENIENGWLYRGLYSSVQRAVDAMHE